MKLDKHFGTCHICGKKEKLTFEHIPPRSAFNDIPRHIFMGSDFIEQSCIKEPWNMKGIKYQQQQRGKGVYSLCQSCNNFTGGKYGNAYIDFSKKVACGVFKALDECPNFIDTSQTITRILNAIEPLSIFKQIISLFCSINSAEYFPEFKEFLLNHLSKNFPSEKYVLTMYFNKGCVEKFCGHTIMLKTDGTCQGVTEITSFPLSFILYDLSVGQPNPLYGQCINDWSTFSYKEISDITLSLPIYEANSWIPLDFRSKEAIKDCIENNQQSKS